MSTAPQDADDDIDDEIVDIFVEEATEVLEGLSADVPKWQGDHGNRPLLTDIRRAFHTLKGSGRMAKALDVAEIAWKVEQALNKALDGTLEINNHLVDMVNKARDAIPALIDALRERRPMPMHERDFSRLLSQIDAVGRGEPMPALEKVAVSQAVSQPAVPALTLAHLEPLRAELAEYSMRLDTIGSNLDSGAAQWRDLAGRTGRLETAVSGSIGQDDLSELRAQLQALNNAVTEAKHLVKATNDKVAQQQRETRDVLDQRITDEVAALMKRNSELSDQLQVLQKRQQDAHRWTLLTVGSCVGGAFVLWLLTYFLMR